MTSSLERLAEMVRVAEAKTRAEKLGVEARAASESLHAVEALARELDRRLRDERPALQRALDVVAEDEQKLKELVRKVAQLLGSAALPLEESRRFEQEIDAARSEIDGRRSAARAELEALTREAAEARRALQAAMDHYQAIRREMDRLQPALAGEFAADDRLARDAEHLFPGGQARALFREVEDASAHFGMLDPKEQLAQLTIWIGRYRRLHALEAPNLDPDDAALLQRVFPKLVGLSKHYEPGYIEAFRQSFNTDWDAYVAEAEDQLRRATELVQQKRQAEQRRREHQARESDRKHQAREDAEGALEELKGVLVRYKLPDEGRDAFADALARALAGRGAADPELLDLVGPHRDLLTGGEFRALRKNLDRALQQEARDEQAAELKQQMAGIVALTRGRKALMLGGSAREDVRRSLERLFEFDELDWESYEDSRPALLDSIESRIRHRGVDLVLILRDFIGHHVTQRLRPAAESAGVPFLTVDHGYGPRQVGEALQRGLEGAA